MMQMHLAAAAVLFLTGLSSAGGSNLRLRSQASTQQLAGLSTSSLLESELGAEQHLGLGAALVNAPTCDAALSDPICYGGLPGRVNALLPESIPNGLVGHWKFDADVPVDSSGNSNHGVTELVHGPAPAGNGHSASFKRTFMMVPNSATLKLADFTYSFWIYLLDDGPPHNTDGQTAAWCPLMRKGVHIARTGQFANAPALLFDYRTGHLRAEVTTSFRSTEDGEHFDSNARLLPNRWVHIALVHHSKHSSLLLYVNGILDSALQTQGTLVTNDYPLYVGGDPFIMDQCGFTVYIDELRVYSNAVPPHQLEAEAAPALGGTDPAAVRLGCVHCSLEEAAKSCPANRHICSSLELHTGGYQVARALGWLVPGAHVWTHAAVTKAAAMRSQSTSVAGQAADATSGLGLCCEGAP